MKFKKYLFLLFLLVIMTWIYTYSTHPVVLKFLFPEKIWVHRVNSAIKLEEVSEKTQGVELDVVWEKDHFDVNHPPAVSIDLSLEEYLAKFYKTQDFGFWLDFKNLDSANMEKSFMHLDSLAGIFGMKKDKIIIEAREPKYLNIFRVNGYLTAYYLPSDFGGVKVKEVKKSIMNNSPDYISTSLGEYVYIKEEFPKAEKLLWHLGNGESFKNKRRMYGALLDNKVKIILLPYVSEVGDR